MTAILGQKGSLSPFSSKCQWDYFWISVFPFNTTRQDRSTQVFHFKQAQRKMKNSQLCNSPQFPIRL